MDTLVPGVNTFKQRSRNPRVLIYCSKGTHYLECVNNGAVVRLLVTASEDVRVLDGCVIAVVVVVVLDVETVEEDDVGLAVD